MKSSLRLWQIVIIVTMTVLNAYSIAEGIKYKVGLGIVFALASLAVLVFCLKLFQQMNNSAGEAEEF